MRQYIELKAEAYGGLAGFARHLGVHRQALHAVVQGRRPVSQELAKRLGFARERTIRFVPIDRK